MKKLLHTTFMKSIIAVLFILLAFVSCTQQKTVEEFPDYITTTKTDKYVRVEGTKIFAIFPPDFKHVKELVRYQKADNLYIQMVEVPTSNFIEARKNFSREAVEAKGAKVDVSSTSKINQYDAIYMDGPSKKDGENKLVLAFGDSTFVVMVVGVYKTNDKAALKELQDILKSIYYDKDLQTDPMELANFTFDKTITGFKYATTMSQLFIYTEDGHSDSQDRSPNSLQLAAMPALDEENAKAYTEDLLRRFKINNVELTTKKITSTTINDYPSFTNASGVTVEGKKGIQYMAVIRGEKSTVVFIAQAFHDMDDMLDKFKRTAASIKIK